MVLTTFDREVYERDLKEDAYEEGYLTGAIKTYIETYQGFFASREDTFKCLAEKFSLSDSEAEKYMEEYWK